MMAAGFGSLFAYQYKSHGCLKKLEGSFSMFLNFHGFRKDGVPGDIKEYDSN